MNLLTVISQKQHSQKIKNLTQKKFHNNSWRHQVQQLQTIAEKLKKVENENIKTNTSDYLDVMELVAIMEPATKSQKLSRNKLPLKSRPSNKMKVVLNSGSDGDLYLLKNEQTNPLPTWQGRCQHLGIHQMGVSKQMERPTLG